MPPRHGTGRAAPPKAKPSHSPVGDAPQTRAADYKRADAFKKTAKYRGATRAAYKSKALPARQAAVKTMTVATPEGAAILHTHKAELKRNASLKAGHARFTGMTDADARKAQRAYALPAFQDAIMEAKRHKTMAGPRLLPGTRNSTTGKVEQDPEHKAKEETAKAVVTNLQQAGVGADKIVAAVNALDKRHQSPAVVALDQLTRGSSMTAGGARAALHGKNPLIGAAKGAIKNDQSWRYVARDLGAGKTVSNVVGTAGDIALDPTTYISLGATAPVMTAARVAKAGALAKGATEEVALAAAKEAYEDAAKAGVKGTAGKLKVGTATGLQVGVRGTPVRAASVAKQALKGKGLKAAYRDSTREVHTKGRVTAALNPRQATVHGGGRGEAAKVGMGYKHRPSDVHPVDFEHIRDAARSLRHDMIAAEQGGIARGKGWNKHIKDTGVSAEDQVEANLARDAGDHTHLTPAQRDLAEKMQRDYGDIADIEGRGPKERIESSGAIGDDFAKGYVFRLKRQDLNPDWRGARESATEAARPGGSQGRRVTGAAFNKRKTPGQLRHMSPEKRATYVLDDIPAQMTRRFADSGRAVAIRKFQDRVGALGHRVGSMEEVNDLGHEMSEFYIRDSRGWKPVYGKHTDNPEAMRAKLEHAFNTGQEVRAVPEHLWETAWSHASRGRGSASLSHVGQRGFDRVQGLIKTAQTVVNPGYHMTNFIGDSFNARLGGARAKDLIDGIRLVRNDRHNAAFLKDVEQSVLAHKPGPGKTQFYKGLGRDASDAEIVELAHATGSIGMGHAGNELTQLNAQANAAKAIRGGPTRALDLIRKANEAREDTVRIASFASALKRGMDPDAAARHVTKHHFDYGDLTEFERGTVRRLIPFYTFGARNIPLQARGLLGTPGRYATVQKTQDALADQAGLDKDWTAGLPDYLQQQMPFALPLKVDGLPLAANVKLPMNDLNSLDPTTWKNQVISRTGTLVKTPIEIATHYDTFTGQPIEGKSKLVPAPDLPGSALDNILSSAIKQASLLPGVGEPKITKTWDPKQKRWIKSWPWWVDKIARTAPGSSATMGVVTKGRDAHHRGLLNLAGWAAGPRPMTVDPTDALISQLFEALAKTDDEREQLKKTVKHTPGEPWGGKIAQLQKKSTKIQGKINKASGGQYFATPKKKASTQDFGPASSGGKDFGP